MEFFKKSIKSLVGLYILRKRPVIIYSNGHSGSIALLKSLQKVGIFAFKVEHIATLQNYRGIPKSTFFVKNLIIEKNLPADYISLVREPLSLMISWYFSKLKHIPEAKKANDSENIKALQEIFLSKYLNTDLMDKDLHWFEQEMNKTLNTNIYELDFDATAGYSSAIISGERKVLILRTELPNKVKAEVIKEFLNFNKDLEILISNTRDKKYNAHLYEDFKRTLQIPDATLQKIYSSRYSKHFLTNEEIAKNHQKFLT